MPELLLLDLFDIIENNSVPELLLWDLFDFLGKPFEMASRKNDSVFKGSKSTSDMFLIELSTICRWNETCDIECWGRRQPLSELSEYSFFLPISGLENVCWKQTFFRSLVWIHCSGLWLTLYHVQLTAPTEHVVKLMRFCAWIVTYCRSVPELLLWDLENPLKWLAEEMIQFLKAPNYIRHVLLEHSTICRWKETCDIECWGLTQPLSEYFFF